MVQPTIDFLVPGGIVMHKHYESDLALVLDNRYLKLTGGILNGKFGLKIIEASNNYNVSNDDCVILVNASTLPVLITLPNIINGIVFYIKKIDLSLNVVTIRGSGIQTIEGSVDYLLTSQYKSVTLIGYNNVWYILSKT